MDEFKGIIASGAFRRILEQAAKVASVPRPVMILGERGTGKELVAKYIHANSTRSAGPFVPLNCAALNNELLNAEIYGHEKGAFTGADATRIGKLEQADGGTLFMDEIGNMSMPFQDKILRVVEYQEFQRVRGTKTIKVDVRVISATNANLHELIAENLFRQDLYDRLTFMVLQLPPLRRRVEAIPSLIVHFVQQLHEEVPNLETRSFHQDTVEAMMAYHWPGNVRELKNVVERLYLFGTSAAIMPADLPPEITGRTAGIAVNNASFHEQVEAFKRHLVVTKLAECNNNQREAADALQMTYDQFRHYYRKFGQG